MSEPSPDAELPASASRRWLERARLWLSALTADQRFGLLGVAAALGALGAGLVFVEIAESVLRGERAVTVDARVNSWMADHRVDAVTSTMKVLTRLADPAAIVVVTAGVAAVVVLRGERRLALFMIAATTVTGVLVAITKTLVGRPRPATADHLVTVTGASFPSGHAAQSVACYMAIALVVAWMFRSKTVGIVAVAAAVILAMGIGGSRVYLGVHWTSDVIAGWALASAWIAGLVAALVGSAALRRRRSTPGTPGADTSP